MDETDQSIERILSLKPMEGKTAKSSTGLTDTRLFTGENKLRAIRDRETMLWHCKYDDGITPQRLHQRFTKFDYLMTHVKDYFSKRNIEVAQVS